MRGRALLLSLVLAASAVSSPLPARAEEPTASELTAAREIFKHALALEDKGEWSAALTLFEKVAAVKTTPSVRFHIAFCHEHLGRLVEAYDGFSRAKAEAEADGKPENLTVRDQARQHLADLDGRIPKVVIVVELPDDVSSASVSLDGKPLNPALLGTPVPVDPREHTVTATAAGHPAFETKKKFAERDEPATITVSFDKAATPEAPSPKRSSVAPWVIGGVGLAALGVGVGLYAKSRSIYGEVDDACAGRAVCPSDLQARYDEGRSYNTWANVAIITGSVAVAGAAVWWWTGSTSSDPKAASRRMTIAVTPWSLGVVGAF